MSKLHKTFHVGSCRTVLTGLSVYLLYIQTKKPSKGHKGTKTEGRRTSSQDSRVRCRASLEDTQKVSYRATVCSELTSCSLSTLLSLALPKRRAETQPRHTANGDKACFCERFHSEVANRLQDKSRDHMLQSVQSVCLSSCTQSPSIPPHAWDGPTQRGWAVGHLMAPEEALKGLVPLHISATYESGVTLDVLLMICGLADEHRGEAGGMEPNICGLGATEGQPQGCGL